MFAVVQVYADQSERIRQYVETPEAGAQYLADHGDAGDLYGNAYVRVCRALTWQEAQSRKLSSGDWVQPVWHGEDFWNSSEGYKAREDHYAHIAHDDPTMIAFTPDEAKGAADRQTRMKPGRYLNRYFPDLGAKRIAFLAEWWTKGQRPPVDCGGEMQLATTGDEMIAAYASDHVDSCMQHMDCVRVYAAGDLAVAHWVDGNGETVARALCWPEKAIYGRVYPDPDCEEEGHEESYGTALVQAMEAKGWLDSQVSSNSFNGARILKETACYGGYVMPYFDRGYGVNHDGDGFVMSSCANIDCDNTDGTVHAEPQYDYECDRCDSGCDDTTEVVTRIQDGDAYSHQSWCECCVNNNTFYCEGLNETVSDYLSQVEVDGDTMASQYAAHEASEGRMWIDSDGDYTTEEPVEAEAEDVSEDLTAAEHGFVNETPASVLVGHLADAIAAARQPADLITLATASSALAAIRGRRADFVIHDEYQHYIIPPSLRTAPSLEAWSQLLLPPIAGPITTMETL